MQFADAIKWRWLAVLVMVWSGYIVHEFARWVMAIPPDVISMEHAAVVGAVYTPLAAVFKFAFDFAYDGKQD